MTDGSAFAGSDRFTPSPRCVSTVVGSETVLLNLDEGTYFGIDEVGQLVWAALPENPSYSDLSDAVQDAYAVDGETAEKDLTSFLHDLESNDLILVQRL